MLQTTLRTLTLSTLLLAAAAPSLDARSAGSPTGHTGAPGDLVCTACHRTTAANSGPGSVKLSFPGNASTYIPGQRQRVTVTIADPAGLRWGFQLTARVAGDAAATSGAGTLATVDDRTQLQQGAGTLQWITHTSGGTRPGATGPVTFEVDWTPPATGVGPVDFYVAGNAANNSMSNAGDNIYTSKVSLTQVAAAQTARPAISTSGVVNGASFRAGIAPGSFFSIAGTNLAPVTRTWRDNEFLADKLPTMLDGTKVTVNGKPAAIAFISPTQINAQAPDETATGNVNVVVTNDGGESAPMMASLRAAAPAFFPFAPQGNRYVAATDAAGTTLIGPAGLFGTTTTTRPARPGETVILYGTGFGVTNPAVRAGDLFVGAAPLVASTTVTIGGLPATVTFAGLSAAGLNQVNVTVPAGAPDGDLPVIATVSGVATPDGIVVSVRR